MNPIKRVAIVGGTHGNEFTGVYLVKKFLANSELIRRNSLETQVLFGNPKAIEQCKRYIDKDLNRCFKPVDLQNMALSSYEDIRAKAIQEILCLQNQSIVDVIIDLHSTTSNMQLSILLNSKHPFLLRLAAYLSSRNSAVKVCYSPQSQESVYLDSLSDLGFAIEVGPVAQGVLNAELFQKTEQLVYEILDYFEQHNSGKIPPKNTNLTLYQYTGVIDYPRNERGEIQAMIHPQLQFRDYKALNPGDPMFFTFEGKEILYEGTSTVYPVFINEAAYYEKGIAMCLTQKQQVSVDIN